MFTKVKKSLLKLPSTKGQKAKDTCRDFLAHNIIEFEVEKFSDESGTYYLAKSVNLQDGQIVTTGKDITDLDKNIKDAIYTAFDVPAYYCNYDNMHSNLEIVKELKYAIA